MAPLREGLRCPVHARARSPAHASYDDGRYLATLRGLVAVPTESQMPQRRGDLYRYCGEVLPPAGGDGVRSGCWTIRGRSRARAVGTRMEDAAPPTVLDVWPRRVVRGLAAKWRRGGTLGGDGRGRPLYGRGTVSNKGQHLIAMEALRAVMAERGGSASTADACGDGEEVGSPGLGEMLVQHRGQVRGGRVHRAGRAAADDVHAGDLAGRARRGRVGPGGATTRGEHHSGHGGACWTIRASSWRTPGRHRLAARQDPGRGLAPKQVPAAGMCGGLTPLVFEDIAGVPEGRCRVGRARHEQGGEDHGLDQCGVLAAADRASGRADQRGAGQGAGAHAGAAHGGCAGPRPCAQPQAASRCARIFDGGGGRGPNRSTFPAIRTDPETPG